MGPTRGHGPPRREVRSNVCGSWPVLRSLSRGACLLEPILRKYFRSPLFPHPGLDPGSMAGRSRQTIKVRVSERRGSWIPDQVRDEAGYRMDYIHCGGRAPGPRNIPAPGTRGPATLPRATGHRGRGGARCCVCSVPSTARGAGPVRVSDKRLGYRFTLGPGPARWFAQLSQPLAPGMPLPVGHDGLGRIRRTRRRVRIGARRGNPVPFGPEAAHAGGERLGRAEPRRHVPGVSPSGVAFSGGLEASGPTTSPFPSQQPPTVFVSAACPTHVEPPRPPAKAMPLPRARAWVQWKRV